MNLDSVNKALDAFAGVPDAAMLDSATLADTEAILRLYEKLVSDLRLDESQIALERYRLSMIEDPIERALQESIHSARSMLTHRRIVDLKGSISAIEAWLDSNLHHANNGAS